jgi:acyl-CoA synthetase (AMP-forming)/AMP-acid ligase II
LISANANITRHLAEMAERQPARAALKIPRGRTRAGDIDYLTLSFSELDGEVAAWAERLSRAGVNRGDRTLVMVRQGLPLIAAAFALFRVGAVPVIIDPGMGLKNFLRCVASSRPRALVGIPLAQLVSRVFLRSFSSVSVRITAPNSLTASLQTNSKPKTQNPKPAAAVTAADLAAILFTSGSTGAPKGVCYEHGMFEAQVEAIRATYQIEPGEIDLPMLPIFALFNPSLGMTTVVPEIDPRRPAAVDPAKIVQAIQQEKVTNSFGSPTLWGKISEHCIEKRITLPTLRRVLSAGAPVPAMLWGRAREWMPNGLLHSPYGATEALPVSTVSSADIAQVTGIGACVGRPLPNITVKIIAISDDPIATLDDAKELPVGEIGEIIVSGPVVTKEYDHNSSATAAAKISQCSRIPQDADRTLRRAATSADQPETQNPKLATAPRGSAVWHRMGDCGYLDREGRLWFCGRKVERVETSSGTLYTEPCEQVFRGLPSITRCALIGLGPRGKQIPALVVECLGVERSDQQAIARVLRSLALSQPHTREITRFYFHPRFPVDVRHNAKIHRLTLARWAAKAKPVG